MGDHGKSNFGIEFHELPLFYNNNNGVNNTAAYCTGAI